MALSSTPQSITPPSRRSGTATLVPAYTAVAGRNPVDRREQPSHCSLARGMESNKRLTHDPIRHASGFPAWVPGLLFT